MTIQEARQKATEITKEHVGVEGFHAASSHPYTKTCFMDKCAFPVFSGAKFLWPLVPWLHCQALEAACEQEEAAAAGQAAFQPSLTCSLSCGQ